MKGCQIVLPDKIKQFGAGKFLLHQKRRDHCKGRPLAIQFTSIPKKNRLTANRRLKHFTSRLRRRRRPVQLVGGDFCGNKNHPIQAQFFHRITGHDEMAVMHGIEAPAKQSDFLRRNHFDRRHKIWFSLDMPSNNPGQLILVGIPGTELDPATANLFREIQPGGFILFGRNIKSPHQLRKLIDDLRSLSDVEPIITIDQEGGRVSRLKLIGNEPPNAQQLRDCGDLDLIRRHGDITGRILRIFGFNLDLCPVLDISFDDEADNSLRGRCYGRNVAEVIEKATAFNNGLSATGVLSCGKHFPGYASAGLDPHHELPRIERSRDLMEAHELAVFRHFAHSVDSMMIGHIAVSGLDAIDRPASLSPAIIRDLLRRDMGFEGLVMTDDLDMGAILNHYGFDETMRLGIEAGNDMLMICHRVEMAAAAKKAIETMGQKLDPALASMARCKAKLAPPTPFSLEKFQAIDAEILDLRIAVLGPERAAERSPEDGKRSPVEIY